MSVTKSAIIPILFVIIGLKTLASATSPYPPPCFDDIYCHGEILHTVQLAEPFPDRKTFVDLPLKNSREVVKDNFHVMMNSTSDNPTVDDIRAFLNQNFGARGDELSAWEPEDWKPNPNFLSYIRDDLLRQFGFELNALWKELGKKISEDVKNKRDMYSLVYLPNPVILPGGRFLELYYWDTYWIIRGLLHCEMTESVRGMLEDFILLLETFGYVPNGNRIYYRRTQPPFLIQMFEDYVDATGDWEFVKRYLSSLENEFNYWMVNRSISIEQVKSDGTNASYVLYRYKNEVTGPRPESYALEYKLAETLRSEEERDSFFMNMKSGAESGWDYSSRWFPINASADSSLLETKTSQVVPVDLNSILFKNAITLAAFHKQLNNTEISTRYLKKALEIETAVNSVLWDSSTGVWFDYDLHDGVLRKEFFPSNIFPLWAGIQVGNNNSDTSMQKVLDYLQDCGALVWDGGIPTSMTKTGQQWDFPNAWPPLQHLFVESLENTGYRPAQEVAFDTAQKWVANNYLTYRNYNDTMFEKYRVDLPGEPGGGGLYDVVVGFGWTNGVIIDFLIKYGNRLSAMYNDVMYQ